MKVKRNDLYKNNETKAERVSYRKVPGSLNISKITENVIFTKLSYYPIIKY